MAQSSPGPSAASQGPNVLVVQPDVHCPLDEFEALFTAENLRITVVRPFEEAVPAQLEADALVVLGGGMGANDDEDHPWLADVRALQRQAVEAGTPTLGICLGAQLLARAMGGAVEVGAAGLEAGPIDVHRRSTSIGDPLLAGLPGHFWVGALHRDEIVELPPGAAWLAQTEMYRHQAFRIGERAWGVQFHPEILSAGFARWVRIFVGADETETAIARDGLAAFTQTEEHVRRATARLGRNFADIVRSATAPTRSAASLVHD